MVFCFQVYSTCPFDMSPVSNPYTNHKQVKILSKHDVYAVLLNDHCLLQLKGVWQAQKTPTNFKITTSAIANEILVKVQAPK